MGAHVTGSRQAGLRDEGFRRRLSFSEALGSFERVLAALPTPRTKVLGKKMLAPEGQPKASQMLGVLTVAESNW